MLALCPRIAVVLEGGYDLEALASLVGARGTDAPGRRVTQPHRRRRALRRLRARPLPHGGRHGRPVAGAEPALLRRSRRQEDPAALRRDDPRGEDVHRRGAHRAGARPPQHRQGARRRPRERARTSSPWSTSRGAICSPICRRGVEVGNFLPRHLAVAILAQAARGLVYAHEKTDADGTPLQVVHCDISPGNIVVGWGGTVKLVDFGIARATIMLRESDHSVAGKYNYMAPEQIRGEAVDARADLFALGVILYELTVGKRLFRGRPEQVIRLVLDEPIPKPTELRPDFPASLERIILRALERDPARRYQTARELRTDLHGVARRDRPVARQAAHRRVPALHLQPQEAARRRRVRRRRARRRRGAVAGEGAAASRSASSGRRRGSAGRGAHRRRRRRRARCGRSWTRRRRRSTPRPTSAEKARASHLAGRGPAAAGLATTAERLAFAEPPTVRMRADETPKSVSCRAPRRPRAPGSGSVSSAFSGSVKLC